MQVTHKSAGGEEAWHTIAGWDASDQTGAPCPATERAADVLPRPPLGYGNGSSAAKTQAYETNQQRHMADSKIDGSIILGLAVPLRA